MKVCRMCWALLDDQLNKCDCIAGADPSLNFKDVAEAINHFVNHEKLMSKQGRQLIKLVEGRIQDFSTPVYPNNHFDVAMIKELQDLLDKSKVNQK